MTQIPSYLSSIAKGSLSGAGDLHSNFSLRIGEVKEILYPENGSGDPIQYVVSVAHKTPSGGYTTVPYYGVTASTVFGGAADLVSATYRAASSQTSEDGDVGSGSKVLLLCVSGDQSKGFILGGVPDYANEGRPKSPQGHHYHFEFNGAQFQVNNEGEVQFWHKGPTNADGSVQEQYKEAGGSTVRIDKRGNIAISGPGGQQFLKFINQQTSQTSDGAERFDPTISNSVELQADKRLQIRGEQVESTAQNKNLIESKTDIIKMEAANGVHVGQTPTDKWVKGTTYRLAESSMNQTLATSLTSAASALTSASVTLSAAAVANAIPIVGGMLAMGPLVAVAAQLAVVASSFGTMAGAIQSMEAQSQTFLSDKNWTD